MGQTIRQERFESYEVYDDKGNSVGRVVFPKATRSSAAGRGTVYLRRQPPLRPARTSRAA